MIVQTYLCTLENPLVLFSKSKTEANVESLDYIPGNVFRGIVAGKLYKMDAEHQQRTLDVFHNGKVQFGDAHLSDGQHRAFKMPAVCYTEKNVEDKDWKIYLHHQPADGKPDQLEQVKGGYVLVDNEKKADDEKPAIDNKIQLVKAKLGARIKSAWDRATRSSKDEKLYMYQYLEKGQKFMFGIRSENEDYLKKIKEELTGTQHKYIGKSRSAEFGKVGIEFIEEKEEETLIQPSLNGEKHLIVYAESNLCFLDEYNEFTWKPTVGDLGLKGGEINWELSQIWRDTYVPWNGHRKTHDPERLIIKKGSVFIVNKATPGDIITEKANHGIGYFLSEGFGRVLYNPEFFNLLTKLKKKEKEGRCKGSSAPQTPNEEKPSESSESQPSKKVETSNPFLQALENQKQIQEDEFKIDALVNDFLTKVEFKGKEIKNSQWGAIFARAKQAKDDGELMDILFEEAIRGNEKAGFLFREKMKDKWSQRGRIDKLKTFILDNTTPNHNNFQKKLVMRLAREKAKDESKLSS